MSTLAIWSPLSSLGMSGLLFSRPLSGGDVPLFPFSVIQFAVYRSGADSIGYEGTTSRAPTLQIAGHGGHREE